MNKLIKSLFTVKCQKSNVKCSLRGFTLIELLVVIAIIGLLATIVAVSVNSARAKARDVKRGSDLKNLTTALEMYYDKYNAYPVAAAWTSKLGCYGPASANWIPGLAPEFIPALPADPQGDCSVGRDYLYASNGTDHKLLIHVPENCSNPVYKNIVDPVRICWAWASYTPGYRNW